MFPRFVLDDELRFMPAPGTATVNFWQLQDLLLSKDLSRIKELDWIDKFGKGMGGKITARLLDGKVNMSGNKIALCSFPRSGNSLTRKLLEQITGVATGCESKSDLLLQMVGLVGESHHGNDMVWVTKTHHPID